MVDGARGQVGELDAGRGDLGVAGMIGEFHDRIGVGDIEVVADQRHAERRVQPFEKDGPGFGDAVAVGVAQQRDAIGARRIGAGAAHDHLRDPALDAPGIVGLRRRVGLGHQHIAIRQDKERARMIEPGGERIDRHSAGGDRFAAGGPADRFGDIDRRDQGIFRRRQRGRGSKRLFGRGGVLLVAGGERNGEARDTQSASRRCLAGGRLLRMLVPRLWRYNTRSRRMFTAPAMNFA